MLKITSEKSNMGVHATLFKSYVLWLKKNRMCKIKQRDQFTSDKTDASQVTLKLCFAALQALNKALRSRGQLSFSSMR